MPVEVLREIRRRLPDVRLWNFYGQTEMAPLATCCGPTSSCAQRRLRRPGGAQRRDPRGRRRRRTRCPPGEVGEIVHRSPHAMLGYWRRPGARPPRRSAAAGSTPATSGVMDEDGYLTVVDRKKDMIKTGGENVASREVEEALYQHPAVAEVAVFGVPHPHWIEAVTAAVVLREGRQADGPALIQFAKQHLASYKVPKTGVHHPGAAPQPERKNPQTRAAGHVYGPGVTGRPGASRAVAKRDRAFRRMLVDLRRRPQNVHHGVIHLGEVPLLRLGHLSTVQHDPLDVLQGQGGTRNDFIGDPFDFGVELCSVGHNSP